MKKGFLLFIICLLTDTASAQRRSCLDRGWYFLLGDGHTALTDPSTASFGRVIDLPHDWSVESEAGSLQQTRHIPEEKGIRQITCRTPSVFHFYSYYRLSGTPYSAHCSME
ncbi:MAG: hypothetical protein K6C30_07415 [Bacteroidaceae bacterium]|nr:hypothetical protein [Bacteroidaceae bacterium]